MENIGIDFGSYKSVLATSRGNGTIIFDENTKRTISTTLELTNPIRRFGNFVSGPKKKEIHLRYRNFSYFNSTNEKNDIGVEGIINDRDYYIYYFLGYLKRLIKEHVTNFTLCVPYFYTFSDRKKIYDLCVSLGMNVTILTDISSVASHFLIKSSQSETTNKFVVLDLGHSKSTIGLFSKTNENECINLEPISIKGIYSGSLDYDLNLLNFIQKKFSIPSSAYNDEKILMQCNKIKTMLNAISDFGFSIEIDDETFYIQITREEYHELIKSNLESLKHFLLNFVEENKIADLNIEIVGGNSYNIFVQKIIEEVFQNNRLSYGMNAVESCAIGASMLGAINKFGSRIKFSLKDMVNDKISMRLFQNIDECSKSNINTITKNSIVVPSNYLKISCKKDKPFYIDFIDNKGIIVKRIHVKNPDGNIDVCICFTKKGILELDHSNTNSEKEIEIDEHVLINLKDIQDKEIEFRTMEKESLEIGNMRNELESCIMNINENLLELNEEEKEKLNQIREMMMYEEISKTIKEESKKRNKTLKSLEFIEIRIKKILQEKKDEIKKIIINNEEIIKEINTKNLFIRGIYQLQGIIVKINGELDEIKGSIFEIDKIYGLDAQKIIKEIEKIKNEVLEEVKIKEEENKKKLEEEIAKKDEDLKKNEKDQNKDAENGLADSINIDSNDEINKETKDNAENINVDSKDEINKETREEDKTCEKDYNKDMDLENKKVESETGNKNDEDSIKECKLKKEEEV